MRKIKGVQWEVKTMGRPELYYVGRGETPGAALRDLEEKLQTGLDDASSTLNQATARLNAIREAIADVTPFEETELTQLEKAFAASGLTEQQLVDLINDVETAG